MSTNFIVKNLKEFQKALEQADKDRIKAAQTAVKVEAHRLMKGLREEIKAGAPGGKPFSPLSLIAQARKGKKAAKTPLARMAPLVRYGTKQTENGMTVSVGFQTYGTFSPRWLYLVEQHQKGFTRPVTDKMREALIAMGARLGRSRTAGKKRVSNAFFLKKTTTQIDIPARPIIEPFWDAHKQEAEQNIALNFYRKMRGERI